jgi:NADPH:quinone reductase-like Zn-dependent oxidoreductase
MKAIIYDRYGSADVLRCEDVANPVPQEDEVLIKVHAASVNPLDWHFMRGAPYFFRMVSGVRKAKSKGLGVDVAGRVEGVGRKVVRFHEGDAVFGAARGAFAEYACARESALAIKPDNVNFAQAAAVPIAGLTGLQALRDKAGLQSGQKVLINGASGGVGTLTVQIAKSLGAQVTGVCSTRNVELVRSLGADCVLDYTQQDFTQAGQRYDLLLDCIGNHPLSACRRLLTPQGTYVMIGGGAPNDAMMPALLRMMTMLLTAPLVRQKITILMARQNAQDLATLATLLESGKVKPVIDRCYPLSEVAEAIRYVEAGHAQGKVVVAPDGE